MYSSVLFNFPILSASLNSPSRYMRVTPNINLHCCRRALGMSFLIEFRISCRCSSLYPFFFKRFLAFLRLVPSFSIMSWSRFHCSSVIISDFFRSLTWKFSLFPPSPAIVYSSDSGSAPSIIPPPVTASITPAFTLLSTWSIAEGTLSSPSMCIASSSLSVLGLNTSVYFIPVTLCTSNAVLKPSGFSPPLL